MIGLIGGYLRSAFGSPRVETRRGGGHVVYVTSFPPAMYQATGAHLVRSFLDSDSPGTLLVCHEGNLAGLIPEAPGRLIACDLDHSPFLKDWLAANQDVIPRHLGGSAGRCRCPWPDDPKPRKHRPGCVGSWYNKNASRWFRKIVSLDHALTLKGVDVIVWIDSDCVFRRQVPARDVLRMFRNRAVFYLKSRDRAVAETGIMGFHLSAGGRVFLKRLIERFRSGTFRQDVRWDDSWQFERTRETSPEILTIDLATRATGHCDVVPNSPLGKFFEHHKGTHGHRGLGLMA